MTTTLTIGIQGKGSTTVEDLGILGALVESHTGIRLEPRSADSVLPRLDWIHRGEIDLFYEGSSAIVYMEGRRPEEIERWRGPFPLQIIASAHSGASGFIVRADSPIRTIYDIGPQTRIATSPMASETIFGLLAWLKLNKGAIPENPREAEWNVKLVAFPSWEANLKSVPEGTADVACVTAENPLVKQAALKAPGIRFLDLPVKTDPEGLKRFHSLRGGGIVGPAPEYGVREAWGVNCPMGTACVWCRPEFDVELDYKLTRWLDENYDLFKDKGNKLRTYDRKAMRWTFDTAMAPVHAGTIKYFREINLWGSADDTRQEYNLKLMDWYCDLWKEALAQADRKGVAVAAANKQWIELWATTKRKAKVPPYHQMADDEIEAGLALLKRLGR